MMVLLLFWPARISTQASVLRASVSLAPSGAVTLTATDWKVEPNSRTITVPLPRWATPVIQGVLRVRPALCRDSKFLWGAGDSAALFLPRIRAAIARYLAPHDPTVQPHDCRRFTASAWRLGGASPEAVMIMGGWTSPDVMESTYVNAALTLPPHVLRLYRLPTGREPPPIRGSSPPAATSAPEGSVFDLLPASLVYLVPRFERLCGSSLSFHQQLLAARVALERGLPLSTVSCPHCGEP